MQHRRRPRDSRAPYTIGVMLVELTTPFQPEVGSSRVTPAQRLVQADRRRVPAACYASRGPMGSRLGAALVRRGTSRGAIT